MGISDHMSMEELGHQQTHMFDGEHSDMMKTAVDVLACGPLIIVNQPDSPEDDRRDQQAFFMRVKLLDETEIELMFHLGQVMLLHEQAEEVMNLAMASAMKFLDAPQELQDDWAKNKKDSETHNVGRYHIIELAESIARIHEGVEHGDMSKGELSGDVKRLLDKILGITTDDDGHVEGCSCDKHDEG